MQLSRNYVMYHGKRGGGINLEIGIDIYMLLDIKYMTNKNLLCRRRNATQYSSGLYGKIILKSGYMYMYN